MRDGRTAVEVEKRYMGERKREKEVEEKRKKKEGE